MYLKQENLTEIRMTGLKKKKKKKTEKQKTQSMSIIKDYEKHSQLKISFNYYRCTSYLQECDNCGSYFTLCPLVYHRKSRSLTFFWKCSGVVFFSCACHMVLTIRHNSVTWYCCHLVMLCVCHHGKMWYVM